MFARLCILSLFAITSPVDAHDVKDPEIDVDGGTILVRDLMVKLVQSGIQLTSSKELASETEIRVGAESAHLSKILRQARYSTGVCAFLSTSTHPKSMMILKLQSCALKNKMCTWGRASLYPGPRLIREGGTMRVPRLGPFLCGGEELARMLVAGETHVDRN